MSESIWKKEISLGRKPKLPKAERPEVVAGAAAPAEPKQSIWKKEIGGKKKASKAAKEPKAEQKQSFWKKDVSLARARKQDDDPIAKLVAAAAQAVAPDFTAPPVEPAQHVPSPTELAEAVVAAQAAEPEPQPEPEPEPAAVAPVEGLPVSVPAAVEAAPPLAAVEDTLPSLPEVPVEAVAEYHVETAPVEEWMEPAPLEPVESWLADPELPPAPEPEPAVVVHPPVPAADLPPLPAEPKQPFWKKELSFGKKAAPAAAAAPVVGGIHPPVAAADLPALPAAKAPFWKKELSFGKKPKPQAAAAAVPVAGALHPPVPAAELPALPTAKMPFWKKELSLGKPKAPKAATAPRAKKGLELPKLSLPSLSLPSRSRGGGGGHHQVKRLVGLKIGGSQLAAARVANNGAAELLQVARVDLAPGVIVAGELRDPDSLAVALKAFFAANKLPRKNVRLGIASNRIGVRTFDIAGIDDAKQLENAVHFRAQEALPIPLDEAVLDYHILEERVDEEGNSTKRVLLVVAYRELVDRYVSACRKAGITLSGIDLEAFALLRALSAPREDGQPRDSALVAVAIGHERSTFAVSDGRVCEFTRVLEWGGASLNVAIARALNLAPSEVEGVKRAVSLASNDVPEGISPEQYALALEAVRKQVSAFARELVSSLQFYQNQPGSLGIGEIAITGGTANLIGLADELQRLIGVQVRVGDPLARLKMTKKVSVDEPVGSLAVAIGLGIED